MKRRTFFINLLVILTLVLAFPTDSQAQRSQVRPSLKATVSQTIGADTVVTIVYSRPNVKGRKIWGDLVPYGLAPGNKYSKGKPYPWRMGANENTTIEFSKDVLIEGKQLAAGKYGMHAVPSEKDWVVIFNKVNKSWGSYAYDKAQDALRITVTPSEGAFLESLAFYFYELAGTSAVANLHWEKLRVPFKVEVVKE